MLLTFKVLVNLTLFLSSWKEDDVRNGENISLVHCGMRNKNWMGLRTQYRKEFSLAVVIEDHRVKKGEEFER